MSGNGLRLDGVMYGGVLSAHRCYMVIQGTRYHCLRDPPHMVTWRTSTLWLKGPLFVSEMTPT